MGIDKSRHDGAAAAVDHRRAGRERDGALALVGGSGEHDAAFESGDRSAG